MISVIIATKNRSANIISCVQSLLSGTLVPLEILILDQSANNQTKQAIATISHKAIRYTKLSSRGKSNALNYGITQTRGDILAFTDDDCIVDSSWLTTIERAFTQHTNVVAVFGRTLPYHPNQHKDHVCPCIFLNKDKKTITKPCLHYQHIGFGNNMAVRRTIFDQIGEFKEWLGPGSIGSNAEDAEFALRLLITKRKILYNPTGIVYHNKWLTPEEMAHQNFSYYCGEMACYSYFHFQKYPFAAPIVSGNVLDSYYKVKTNLKNFLLFRWNSALFHAFTNTGIETWSRLRGLIVGYVYTLIDPIGCVAS